jgi:hypothetical protein
LEVRGISGRHAAGDVRVRGYGDVRVRGYGDEGVVLVYKIQEMSIIIVPVPISSKRKNGGSSSKPPFSNRCPNITTGW